MEPMMEEILRDLYALDGDLIQYDTHLRKALTKIIESKPNTQFDEAFKLQLRAELMEKVSVLQAEKTEEKKSRWNFGQLFSSRWALAAPALAVLLVAVFLGYGQYQKNGGLFLAKQNVQFALAPTMEDAIGVDPSSKFMLSASKDLSEATIKKVVTITPETDFTVEKIQKTVSIFSSAYAAVDETQVALPFQYEIRPKGELEKDKIYKIAIKNEQIADRDYQWAYQIKAPFGAVESTPKNKDTSVPLATGIEIKFNRPLPDNAKEYFSISPNVEGTLEKKYDTLYFHPKNLAEKKVYTVTIKKGMICLGDGEISQADYIFSFETNNKADDEDKNEFEMIDTLTTVNTSMHPMLGVRGEEGGEFEARLYSLGGADDFMASYAASRNTELSWSDYSAVKNIDEYIPKKEKIVFSAKAELVDENFFEIPQNLEEGYYFYEIKRGAARHAGWIVSTNVAHYYSLLQDNSLFWVYDFANKKVIEKARVSYINEKEVNIGETDKEGILKFSTPSDVKKAGRKNPQFIKIDAPGLKPVVIFANEEGYELNDDSAYWKYLSVDKNKYRTTDSINYWGILKGRKTDIRGKKLSVGLYSSCPNNFKDPDEQDALPLVSAEASISDFDTVSGKLAYTGIDVGWYCLALRDAEKKEVLETAYISVETYDKPAYQITVESSKKAVFAGEEVAFKIKADFYDGTPVSNQELKYQSYGVDEKRIKLDSFGEAELRYVPQYDKDRQYPLMDKISFSPVLAEEGDIWGEAEFQVFGPRLAVSSAVKKIADGKYSLGANLRKISLPDNYQPNGGSYYNQENDAYLGEVVGGYDMKAKIVKITYEKKETGEYYDYITKTQKKTYAYEQKEEGVDEIAGKTDATGNWNMTKDFEVNQDVAYRVDFTAADAQGKKASSSGYIYFGMSSGDPMELELSGSRASANGNQEFSFGDKVQLTLNTQEDDKSIDNRMLIYRYQNEIDEVDVVNGSYFEESFETKFSPSVTYTAVILTQYGFQESPSAVAKLKEADKQLNVEIKPVKTSYRPGEEAQVQIVVKDKAGKPVSAEVNVAVVDEALFQNSIDWNANILTSLYEEIFASRLTDYTQYANKENGGGKGGGGDSRSVFLDVVHYVTIKTDSNGLATTSFKMPDNLTGWRITARAFDTSEMTAGQNNSVIATSLPFFVDATLNATYLTGDAPQLKMRFFGDSYDPNQPVDYVVSSTGLKINQKNSTKERTSYVLLGALPRGEYEIKIEAKQGEKSDALIRKISVLDGYSQKEETHSYKITPELKNIQGNSNGYTDLLFVDQGKAKFFSSLSSSAGETGVRLDQVAASYLAKAILAKNYLGQEFTEDLDIDRFVNNDNADDATAGLRLLTYGSEDLALSAKVADGARSNIDIGDLKTYFNDSMYNSQADIHRIAKALYGLAALDETVLSKINLVKKNKDNLVLEDKIYIGLGLVKSGDVEGARSYYEEQIRGSIKLQDNQAWIDVNEGATEKEKLTATLGMLVSYLNEREMAEKIWNYLEGHAPQRDLIVLEKTLMAKAELEQTNYMAGEFSFKTNARSEHIVLGKNNQQKISLSQAELASLSFENVQGNVEVISLAAVPLRQSEVQNNPNLKLTRIYKLGDAESLRFAEGDVVKVSLSPQFLAGAPEGGYQITDVLPSGLKPATAKLNAMLYVKEEAKDLDKCNMIWYPEGIDGNRITFSLNKDFARDNGCQNISINYYARVVSKGTFKADAPMLQSMSELHNYFIAPSAQVEIK